MGTPQAIPFSQVPDKATFRWAKDIRGTRYKKITESDYYPEGGGFQHTCKDPNRPCVLLGNLTVWRKGKFTLDENDDATQDRVFEGWTLGDRWNGWAKPYFEWEAVKQIAAMLNANPKGWLCEVRLNEEKQSFILDESLQWADAGATDEEKAEYYTEDDGNYLPEPANVTVYCIGAGSWTWMEVEEAEDDERA